MQYCPFISFKETCIFNNKPCIIYQDYLFCDTHNNNNPLTEKRATLIEKRLKKIFSKLKIKLTPAYLHPPLTQNGEKGKILIVDENKIEIVEVKDNYELTPYEINLVILKKIEKAGVSYTDNNIIDPEGAEAHPMVKVDEAVKNKEKHDIKLITASPHNNTAVILHNGISKVFNVSMDIDEFIDKFSITLFLMHCSFKYDLNESFKSVREIYIFIRNNKAIFEKEPYFDASPEKLMIGEYEFPQVNSQNKLAIPYLKKICDLLGYHTPPQSVFETQDRIHLEKING